MGAGEHARTLPGGERTAPSASGSVRRAQLQAALLRHRRVDEYGEDERDVGDGIAEALGLVLAGRSVMEVAGTLYGGVLADRFPRNRVLAAACIVQGVSQAATAGLVLAGSGSIAAIVVLQALYGAGSAVVWPAEIGLIPDTVSGPRLQQANALMGLTRDLTRVFGPALGGVLVVAGSPGVALGADAASFAVCALLLVRIRVPQRREHAERRSVVRDVREGWREFASHSWLWGSVVCFSVTVFAYSAWLVLGPVVAKEELGGAGAWATVLVAGGAGAVVGGLVAMRLRPRRPLVVSIVALVPWIGEIAALALGVPVLLLAAVAAVGGAGVAVHIALWFTVFQQQIPEATRSRVSSYEALGSLVLAPFGLLVAGPAADAFGIDVALWGAAALGLGSLAAVLMLPSVWAVRRTPAAAAST